MARGQVDVAADPNLGAIAPQSVKTWAYAAFEDFGDEVPPGLNEHLLPISHELLGWLDDPIIIDTDPSQPLGPAAVGSFVPGWSSPFSGLGFRRRRLPPLVRPHALHLDRRSLRHRRRVPATVRPC
jgi:hypothetical protein